MIAIASANGGTVEYKVVFDASRFAYFDWKVPAFGLLFVAVGVGWVFFKLPIKGPRGRLGKIFPHLFLGFSILWTILAFGAAFQHYNRARDAWKGRRAQMLEGTISQFVPPPFTGAYETFVIDNRRFYYSDDLITGCFNHMSTRGGPLHSGVQVRLWAIGNCIVKLEVAEVAVFVELFQA